MRKLLAAIGLSLSLAACGSVPQVVANIFDQVNGFTKQFCQASFTFATIDAIIKALGGPPVAETIGSLLCSQYRALQAQQGPKAAGSAPEGAFVDLGTVIVNGKPVRIQVLR